MHANDPRQREPQSVAEALQIRCPECYEDAFLCAAPNLPEPLTQWSDPDEYEPETELACINQQVGTNAGPVPCEWHGTFAEARACEKTYEHQGGYL